MADTTAGLGSGHPIASVVRAARAGLADTAEAPTWSLSGDETRELLVELSALAAQVAEAQARLLVHGEATGATTTEVQATSTAAWLAGTTMVTRRGAFAATRFADAVVRWEATRSALARGEVLAEQAIAIVEALEALPDVAVVREQCEKHLLAEAAHHDAKALKVLGRRVLEVVAPDEADLQEARLLEEQERRATKRIRFVMVADADGTHTGRFTIPDRHAEQLRKMLMAFAAPKHVRSNGEVYDHRRPTPERMGQAWCELIDRFPLSELPDVGGTNATVVVTVELETLLGGLKVAQLDTGAKITAAAARQLACEAGLIPAVLNGKSQVLDLGRRSRFHTASQRLAIQLAQRHCQGPLCDVPAWLCHVHHTTPWSAGGGTTTRDAQLLCPRHHTLVHRDPPDPPMRT